MTKERASIRQVRKDRTRQAIVDAAVGMLRDGASETLTIANVAARAGVTERTVYRHFRTRGALMRAGWAALQKQLVDSVRAALPALDDHAARRRAAAVQLIRSAQGRSMFRQFGLDVASAGEAASEAMAILLGQQSAD